MGGDMAAEMAKTGRSSEPVEDTTPGSDSVGFATSALLLGQIEALPPEERYRLARRLGLD